MLASPGMDRHLAYVGMTRHREGAELYAAVGQPATSRASIRLKEELSRARPKDSTLDYVQRHGMEAARAQEAEFKDLQREFIG